MAVQQYNKMVFSALIILGIFLILSCNHIGGLREKKVSQKADTGQSDNTQVNENKLTDMKKSPDNQDLSNQLPCWIKTQPENCPSLKKMAKDFILLPSYIMKTDKYDKLSDEDAAHLKNIVAQELIQQISVTVISDIEDIEQCKQDECRQTIRSMITVKSKNILNIQEIKLVEKHWQKINSNEWALWGLGKFSRYAYEQKMDYLKNIVKKKVDIKPKIQPTQPVEPVDVLKKGAPLPHEPVNKPLNNIDLSQTIDFKPLPTNANFDQVVSMIQQDFIEKRQSKKNGLYPGHNKVLNTDTIERRFNVPFETAETIIQKEFSKNKKNWQRQSKKEEVQYVETIRKKLKEIDDLKILQNELSVDLNGWNYSTNKIKILKQQYDARKKYYDLQQTLYNLYCLTFTLAISEDREENYLFIKNKSDQLAKDEIRKNGLLIQIESNFIQVDDYINSTLRTTYHANVSLDSFGAITFKPSRYRGKLRKFKIDIIEQKTKPNKSETTKSIITDIAKAFVIVSGNEILKVGNDDTCTNIIEIQDACFQTWLKNMQEHSKVQWDTEEKNKIQAMINEVIKDNCETQKSKEDNKNKKQQELWGIKHQIDSEHDALISINDRLKQHGIVENLPVESIGTILKKYSEKYKQQIDDLKKDYESFVQIQPVIAQTLIEGTYDMDKINENVLSRIEEVKDKFNTYCPEINWGEQLFDNHQPVQSEHVTKASIPSIRQYSIPQITLLPVQGRNSMICTVPIFFYIDCISQNKTFSFHKQMNAVEDKSTNTLWKLYSGGPRILKRKLPNDSFFQYPSPTSSDETFEKYFIEYQNFCESYRSYRSKWSHINELREIICVPHYEIISENMFNDNLRLNQWKLLDQSNYYDFANRSSGWIMNTYESLQLLFSGLKESLKKENVDMKIIQMLSNKTFWTNTKVDYQVRSVVVFDFTKDSLIERSKSVNDQCMGILKRKIVD